MLFHGLAQGPAQRILAEYPQIVVEIPHGRHEITTSNSTRFQLVTQSHGCVVPSPVIVPRDPDTLDARRRDEKAEMGGGETRREVELRKSRANREGVFETFTDDEIGAI